MQQELFEVVLGAYEQGPVTNADMYKHVAKKTGVDIDAYVQEVGKQKQKVNTYKRTLRWKQQSLKQSGLIEQVGHGQWRITKSGRYALTQVTVDKHMLAASTELGAIIWADASNPNIFDSVIEDDVHLIITSPPYLNVERSYGTHKDEQAYIDFIVSVLEPVRRRMIKGANLALNVTQDSYIKEAHGKKSLYLEKLTIALSEQLDLHLMDRLVWHTANKAPGPYPFVSERRTALCTKYEPILHFTTNPECCIADNREILNPYSKQMKRLIETGGEKASRHSMDSKHCAKAGNFAKDNGGSIQGNVISIGTTCEHKRALLKEAQRLNLPPHSATFPQTLAEKLIAYLSPTDEGLVVDVFGGYITVGAAAEKLGKPWACVEMTWEYIRTALTRFKSCKGYLVNPMFTQLDEQVNRLRYG